MQEEVNEQVLPEAQQIQNRGGIKLFTTCLQCSPDITWNEWESKGREFSKVTTVYNQHIRWWLGDWIIYGMQRWSDMYAQAVDASMMTYGSLRNCVYVCRRVSPANRNQNLSFEHHYLVASKTPEEQVKWLAEAELNHWGINDLRRAMKGKEPNNKIEVWQDGKNLSNPAKEPEVMKLKYKDFAEYWEKNGELFDAHSAEVMEQSFNAAREYDAPVAL